MTTDFSRIFVAFFPDFYYFKFPGVKAYFPDFFYCKFPGVTLASI
jgi:hypothetical protein